MLLRKKDVWLKQAPSPARVAASCEELREHPGDRLNLSSVQLGRLIRVSYRVMTTGHADCGYVRLLIHGQHEGDDFRSIGLVGEQIRSLHQLT